MANELLDFVDRGNFDFFKFSTAGDSTHEERDLLKSKCQHVLEYAHAAKQDMCLLGFNLMELKRNKAWQDVINPKTGCTFFNHSFADFCDHAFGLSETRTSNFLRIAQFVKISGDNVDFIEPQYAKYNTSQLVELAAVYPESRKFFNPDMTVKDMRAAKNYMKMGSFYKDRTAPNFDLMQGMKAWEERKAEIESQKQDENNGQIPGQMSLENLQEVFEEDAQEKNSTSDLAEDGGEDLIEDVQPVMPEPTSWETEEVEEETEDELFEMDSHVQPAREKEQDDVAETLTSRDKVRNFLNSYEDWFDVSTYFFKSYVHYWKNGAAVFAVESIARANMESEPTTVVRYYWRRNEEERAFEISKDEIWKYIVEHKGEL